MDNGMDITQLTGIACEQREQQMPLFGGNLNSKNKNSASNRTKQKILSLQSLFADVA